jgi:hypothetical protein
MSDSKQISWETMRYYGKVRELLKASGDYSWAKSLKENLLDPATSWKVKDVFERYYNSDESKLSRCINRRKLGCTRVIIDLNDYCRTFRIRGINDPEKLVELLLDTDRRDFYKKAVEKNEKINKIVELQQIEQEFRSKS